MPLSLLKLGSIPVCTGLPRKTSPTGPTARVYPRVYGATSTHSFRGMVGRGLSPCVRGYPDQQEQFTDRLGSIPVCTGLPPRAPGASPSSGVYPRVYGATFPLTRPRLGRGGLSPCVRGYRTNAHLGIRPSGSIPVCTGLPITLFEKLLSTRVYPRVYGATAREDVEMAREKGLSPCVRGYPCYKVSPFRHGRSIFFPSALFLRHFVARGDGLRRATCSPTTT